MATQTAPITWEVMARQMQLASEQAAAYKAFMEWLYAPWPKPPFVLTEADFPLQYAEHQSRMNREMEAPMGG